MSHIKTYVLILSKDFPLTHRKAGTPTSFADLVASGKKIHTIRGNYDLWDQRIKDVQEGKAVLSLRQWTGRPYASEQVEIQQLTAESGVGIQNLNIHLRYTHTDYIDALRFSAESRSSKCK